MRLIDARCLAHRFSGIQRFTVGLLRALATDDTPARILVRGSTDLPPDLADAYAGQIRETGRPPHPLRDAWPAAWPRWIREAHGRAEGRPVEVICPDAFGPLRLPRDLDRGQIRRFITLHDVIPLRRPHQLGRSWKGRMPGLWRRWLRMQCGAADRVLTVSRFSADTIADELGVDPARIRVVYNTVERYPDEPDPPDLAADRVPYVLCVGRADPYKNRLGLAEAFAAWVASPDAARLPDLRLVFLGGSDPRYPETEAFVATTSSIRDRVHFVRHATEAGLAGWYRHAHLVACPSLDEGFGLPLAEALLWERPVLAQPVASLPEVAAMHASGHVQFASDLRSGLAAALADARPRLDGPPPHIDRPDSPWSLEAFRTRLHDAFAETSRLETTGDASV